MDNFFRGVPKPIIAIVVILGVIIFLHFAQPPKTICDSQISLFQESFNGILFPVRVKKITQTPMIKRTKEVCIQGNSSGSCYEYFMLLKKIAMQLKNTSSECVVPFYEIPEVASAINEGIVLMALKAWGEKPPESYLARGGWMQETEMAVFCHLKDAFIRGHGGSVNEEESQAAWEELKNSVFARYPYSPNKLANSEKGLIEAAPRAISKMSSDDIYKLSLFSIQCAKYR